MKIRHTSIAVKNMEESIRFYRDVMGLELRGRREVPENKAEIAFLRDSESGAEIELTYYREKEGWTEGDELDHIAFEVPDLDRAMEKFKRR